MKKDINLCDGCDLCCRKYKIYLFPKEAKAIAHYLKINYKDFVKNYLDYYFELFQYQPNLETNFLEFNFQNKKYFLFLTLALKQRTGGCIFLKNKECTIYSVRPLICRLFPDFKFYGETFDFCKLDKQNRKTEDPRVFYPIMAEYLTEIKEKGFHNVWKYLPDLCKPNVYFVINGKKQKVSEKILSELKSIL